MAMKPSGGYLGARLTSLSASLPFLIHRDTILYTTYNICMTWQDIEERLKKALTVNITFPRGSVWLPDRHLTIDEWLVGIAETDDELKQLNIPRIRFLQNHWPVEKLVELELDSRFNRRVIWTLNVGSRAYILWSDGQDYQLIAAIEPRDNAALYRGVIGKLLQTP